MDDAPSSDWQGPEGEQPGTWMPELLEIDALFRCAHDEAFRSIADTAAM